MSARKERTISMWRHLIADCQFARPRHPCLAVYIPSGWFASGLGIFGCWHPLESAAFVTTIVFMNLAIARNAAFGSSGSIGWRRLIFLGNVRLCDRPDWPNHWVESTTGPLDGWGAVGFVAGFRSFMVWFPFRGGSSVAHPERWPKIRAWLW